MVETTIQFHPETKKPMPVSFREYELMDRHELKAFHKTLSRQEYKDLQLAVVKKLFELKREDRRELEKTFVAKLEKRDNASIGDKVELFMARARLKQLMIPEKHPIFFRKFRQGEPKTPKFLANAKSPYLI